MLLAEPFQFGDLRGTMFTFEKAGEILEKHIHTEENIHVTIVARGRVKVYSHDWEKIAVAGQLVDLRVGEPHEIMALDDNTRIFNILKMMGGKSAPNEYTKV